MAFSLLFSPNECPVLTCPPILGIMTNPFDSQVNIPATPIAATTIPEITVYLNKNSQTLTNDNNVDIIYDDFQNSVNDSLLRHKSILDVLTKFSESNARVNRAIAKSVTNCGCIEVNAKKQKISEDNIINNLHDSLDDHLNGTLCESCREVIESEIANNLFW